MACAARSARSRLISSTWVVCFTRKPSRPSTIVSKLKRRAESRVNVSSSARTKGPTAHEALLSLARPRRRALRPSTSRRLTSLPRVTPTMAPARLITSTSSGSGLLQTEAGWMPTRAPSPTAAMGGHLAKSSASGPIPTSRYCDHMPRATRTSLMRAASGDPGLTPRRSGPMMAWISRRTPSASAGLPRARSSMTRSSRLATKVTPLALTACRSQGASSQGREESRWPSRLLATMSPRRPRAGASLMAARSSSGAATFRRWLTVGYDGARSTTSFPRTATTLGPCSAGTHTRPTSRARASRGTHSSADSFALDVIVLSLASPVQPGAQQAAAVVVAEVGAVVLQRAVPHEEGDGRIDLDDVLLDGHQTLDLVDEPPARGHLLGPPLANQKIGEGGVVDLGHVARVTGIVVGEEVVVGIHEGRGPIVHGLVVAGGGGRDVGAVLCLVQLRVDPHRLQVPEDELDGVVHEGGAVVVEVHHRGEPARVPRLGEQALRRRGIVAVVARAVPELIHGE